MLENGNSTNLQPVVMRGILYAPPTHGRDIVTRGKCKDSLKFKEKSSMVSFKLHQVVCTGAALRSAFGFNSLILWPWSQNKNCCLMWKKKKENFLRKADCVGNSTIPARRVILNIKCLAFFLPERKRTTSHWPVMQLQAHA